MHRWFHPNISNVDSERLLLEQGSDGSFLVRPSKSCAGHFSLSIRRGDRVTHIKIRHSGGFYDLHGGEQFATLSELIQYYTEHGITEKGGEVFELRKPLNSSDPTTERWFHGSISGQEAESLIRKKGVSGSFLVRESQSKVGDYVLTVRTKDESNQADKVSHVIIRHHNNKYDVGGGEKFDSLTELVDYYKRNPMVETTGTVVNMKYPFNATRITASDIDVRVRELSKENHQISSNNKEGFWEEFEHLQHQECKVLFNRKVGQEDRNILKNRYKNILPYDYTRVILKKPISSFKNDIPNTNHSFEKNSSNNNNNAMINTMSNSQLQHQQTDTMNVNNIVNGGDYINANYIKLVDDDTIISPKTKPVSHSKVYIATQGPMPNTVNDFWWMVWQEKSDCIVMVTKEIERGKNKCYRYWPTKEQGSIRCGSVEVSHMKETRINANENNRFVQDLDGDDRDSDFIYREFDIRLLNPDDMGSDRMIIRRVSHYQYFNWPDQNIPPNPGSILNFLDNINRRPIRGPMIVHCSAGIGRSGTLIVIDMLIDQLKHHGLGYEIDIQRIVKVVRAQRSGLVQTEAQYKFIYLAIQNYINLLRQL